MSKNQSDASFKETPKTSDCDKNCLLRIACSNPHHIIILMEIQNEKASNHKQH